MQSKFNNQIKKIEQKKNKQFKIKVLFHSTPNDLAYCGSIQEQRQSKLVPELVPMIISLPEER